MDLYTINLLRENLLKVIDRSPDLTRVPVRISVYQKEIKEATLKYSQAVKIFIDDESNDVFLRIAIFNGHFVGKREYDSLTNLMKRELHSLCHVLSDIKDSKHWPSGSETIHYVTITLNELIDYCNQKIGKNEIENSFYKKALKEAITARFSSITFAI
jgi:hypothetical protein